MAEDKNRIIAQNKRASYDYFIEERIEAGLALTGSEVKSLRQGKANIADCYASNSGNEFLLYNAYIAEYEKANQFNHNTRRPRKLLLHKQEIRKLIGKITTKGYTVVATKIYFDKNNRAKVELGIAKGKKQHDKRQSIKEKDWAREQSRLMKKN